MTENNRDGFSTRETVSEGCSSSNLMAVDNFEEEHEYHLEEGLETDEVIF